MQAARDKGIDWRRWRDLFAARQDRPLPDPFAPEPALAELPGSLARSLAIFQLGESGGGTVVGQARHSAIRGIDRDFAEAMALFVAEEHHHAELLACAVRMLGGELVRKNWTARLFVFGRRLMGLRLKVMVLLAAEVVGICYYRLIASRLPDSRLKSVLLDLARDEATHLEFHCAFLRTQAGSRWRRFVFRVAWRTLMQAAGAVVLIDHRHALIDLGIPFETVRRRWSSIGRRAEWKVCRASPTGDDSQPFYFPVASRETADEPLTDDACCETLSPLPGGCTS
ncbi:MAG: ferritin-like domain-containing protein [Gammaproteobacteria bacterium]|nr:ferritin-like domain-containing protein [Gammaproteobacteria bacterium]MDH4253115.1 ferritin-like domain-containing protein [Gammaproteobacteria bacterium]MDH5308942.1 ferritin-like domain-containing protein [Gammaproteobacteria bacterium]